MNFETISLLLSWMGLGALLAILFRLGHTFELIANTQRELRRAIHHLGEQRGPQLVTDRIFAGPEIASSIWRTSADGTIGPDDLVYVGRPRG
jgi:hypothetical protein